MYRVEAEKIKGSEAFLFERIRGTAATLPTVGEQYVIAGDHMPMLITTPIQHVERIGDEYRFQTLNSVYKVRILGEES